MPLNFFKDSADTGSALASAIRPYANGESGNASILNRPLRNLLNRSEVIRRAVDHQALLTRSDRGYSLVSDIEAFLYFKYFSTGNIGYAFCLNSEGVWNQWDRDLMLVPIVSSATLSGSSPILAEYVFDDGSFSVYPQVSGISRKVAEGAHNILIKIFKISGESPREPIISIEGSFTPLAPDPEEGPVTICVQVSADNTSTINQVVSAINEHLGARSIVTAGKVTGGERTISITDPIGPARLYKPSGSIGGIDDEGLRVTGAQLRIFFESNRIQEGGFVVLDFMGAKERLQHSFQDNTSVLRVINPGVASDTRNLADCTGTIPVCKVLGQRLHFFNGRSFDLDTADLFLDSLGDESRLARELRSPSGSKRGDNLIGAEAKSGETPVVFSLGVGTVNSQLKTLARLGSAIVDRGSSKIGSRLIPPNGPFATISSGSVRAQIYNILNQLSDSAGDNPGASKIGIDEYTHDGETLTQGYVSDQIQDCWARQTVHDQSDEESTYWHKFAILTSASRPFVLVNKISGNGDYTTITAALDAIKTTGGTIYVQGDVAAYSDPYDGLAAVTVENPITVVGLGNVVWQATGGTCFTVAANCEFRNKILFKNISFSGTIAISVTATVEHTKASVECQGCNFSDVSLAVNQTSPNRFIMRNCMMIKSVPPTVSTAVVQATKGHVIVENCKFAYCGSIVNVTNSAVRDISIIGNEFYKCGYATSLSNIPFLISIVGGNTIRIENNTYPDFVHSGDDDDIYTMFCSVTDCSDSFISGNTLDLGIPTSFTAVSGKYAIYTTGTAHRTQIVGNQISRIGTIAGIRTNCLQALVERNNLAGFFSQELSINSAVIYAQAAVALIRNNKVVSDDITAYSIGLGIRISTTIAGVVSGNYLHGVGKSQPGIGVETSTVLVLGNYIQGMTTLGSGEYGIRALASIDYVIAADNTIFGGTSGINFSNVTKSVMHRNSIVPYDNVSVNYSYGVFATVDSIVSSNRIKFGAQVHRYGIKIDSSGNSITAVGNTIDDPEVGIQVGQSNQIVSSNVVRSAKYGIYSVSVVKSIVRGNKIGNDSVADTAGIQFDSTATTQDLVVAGNSITGPRDGILFVNNATYFATFVACLDNLIRLPTTIESANCGIGFNSGAGGSGSLRHSALSGNNITKAHHDTVPYGQGILVGGDKIALWQNIAWAGWFVGEAYFTTCYNVTVGGGIGLGHDISDSSTIVTRNVTVELALNAMSAASQPYDILCTILVVFSAAMGDSIEDIANYTVVHGGGTWTKVSAARTGVEGTSAVLTLNNILPSGDIVVTASADVKDATGNPLDPAQREKTFARAAYPTNPSYPIVVSAHQHAALHEIEIVFSYNMTFDSAKANFNVTFDGETWVYNTVSLINETTVRLTATPSLPTLANSKTIVASVSGNQFDNPHGNPLDTSRNSATFVSGTYPRAMTAQFVTSYTILFTFDRLMSEENGYLDYGGVLSHYTYVVRGAIDGGGETIYDTDEVVYYPSSPSIGVVITVNASLQIEQGQTITVTVSTSAKDLNDNWIGLPKSASFYVAGSG